MLKDVVNDFLDVWEVVGRIGENDVELLAAGGGVRECVLTDDRYLVIILQLVDGFLNEFGTQQILINSHHRQSASRGELVSDVAGACKKVKNPDIVQVKVVVQDVEQALLAHIHSWSHRQVTWRDDVTAAILPTDDSHGLYDVQIKFVRFQ